MSISSPVAAPSPVRWFFRFLALGFLIYSPSLAGYFQFDDIRSILENDGLRHFPSIGWIWSPRLITTWTFGATYHFFKLNVLAYHTGNVLIHIMCSFLVYRLLALTLTSPALVKTSSAAERETISLATGFLFLCHPLQTQAVSYIAQRAASLATLLYLATIYCTAKFRATEKIAYYLSALIAATLALFSKEIAYTLPLVIIFYEWSFWGSPYKNWRGNLFYYGMFFIPLLLVYFSFYHPGIADGGLSNAMHAPGAKPQLPHTNYLFTQFKVLTTYLRLFLWPAGQHLDYDYPISKSLLEFRTLSSLLFLLALVIAAFKTFKNYRLFSFGILWFFVTLSIESSLISIPDVIFEHRMYLAMFGLVIATTALLRTVVRKDPPFIGVIFLLAIACSFLTYQRNRLWADPMALWTESVQKSPGNPRAHINLATFYRQQKNWPEAAKHLSLAQNITPKDAMLLFAFGRLAEDQKKEAAALVYYEKALRIKPDDNKIRICIGRLFEKQGDFRRALETYADGLEFYQGRGRIFYHIASVFEKMRRDRQAKKYYFIAAAINPKSSQEWSDPPFEKP